MVPVQGTPKSGSHLNLARGSGEKREVSKALVGHNRGAGRHLAILAVRNGRQRNTFPSLPGAM